MAVAFVPGRSLRAVRGGTARPDPNCSA